MRDQRFLVWAASLPNAHAVSTRSLDEVLPELREPAEQAVHDLARVLDATFATLLDDDPPSREAVKPQALPDIKQKLRALSKADRALVAGDYAEAWFQATAGLKHPAGKASFAG